MLVGPVGGTIGPVGGKMLAISDMMRDVYSSNVFFSLKNFFVKLADIFDTAELFETFVTMMLARSFVSGPVGGMIGPVGGQMLAISDNLISFFFEKFSRQISAERPI